MHSVTSKTFASWPCWLKCFLRKLVTLEKQSCSWRSFSGSPDLAAPRPVEVSWRAPSTSASGRASVTTESDLGGGAKKKVTISPLPKDAVPPCTRWVLIMPSALGLKMWCRRFLHYQLFDAVGEVEHECSVRLRDS